MSSVEPSLNLPIDCAAQLTAITERAVRMTAASGAMIALRQDGALITLASSGKCVPPAGTPVRPTSFAARCVAEESLLICQDTDADSRVDAAACRALNVRSMMAVPIVSEGGIAGVLAIFTGSPNGFHEDSAGPMRALALSIGELLVPDESRVSSASQIAPDVAVPVPEADGPAGRTLPASEEPDKASEPQKVETMLQVSIPAEPPATPRAQPPVDIATVPLQPQSTLAEDPEPLFLSGFGQEESQENRRRGLKLAIVLLVIAVLAAGQWMFRGRIIRAIRSRFAAHAASVQPVAPAPLSAQPVVVRSVPESGSPAAGQTVSSEVLPAQTHASTPQQNEAQRATAASRADDNSRINRGAAAVATPAEVRPPQLLSRVEPVSPPALQAESIVALNATIMKDGSIGKVTVVSGEPALQPAAIAAVKRWRYRPAYQSGQPIAATVPIEVTFKAAH